MLYESTRGSLHKKAGAQAVIRGIAEDKGLYVPEQIPALPFAPEAMIEKIKKDTVGLPRGCAIRSSEPSLTILQMKK